MWTLKQNLLENRPSVDIILLRNISNRLNSATDVWDENTWQVFMDLMNHLSAFCMFGLLVDRCILRKAGCNVSMMRPTYKIELYN
jgi:hypothetical protein